MLEALTSKTVVQIKLDERNCQLLNRKARRHYHSDTVKNPWCPFICSAKRIISDSIVLTGFLKTEL